MSRTPPHWLALVIASMACWLERHAGAQIDENRAPRSRLAGRRILFTDAERRTGGYCRLREIGWTANPGRASKKGIGSSTATRSMRRHSVLSLPTAKGPSEFFSLIGSPTVGKWWASNIRTLGAKNEEQLKTPLDTTNNGSGADAASGDSAPALAT